MEKKNKTWEKIFSTKLEKGMVLAEDIINEEGIRLLVQGTVIKESHRIKSILKMNRITMVKVEAGEEAKEGEDGKAPLQAPDLKPFVTEKTEAQREAEKEQKSQRVFNQRFHEKCDQLRRDFEKIVSGEAVKSSDLYPRIQDTLEIFQKENNIFQLMQSLKEVKDLTYAHGQNVALTAYSLGKWLDLSKNELEELILASLLIDIGKARVPKETLYKTQPLNEDEKVAVRRHVLHSYDMIKNYDCIGKAVKEAVLYHHERMDGSGYPIGLQGEEIPLYARILAIADLYAALTVKRPYREAKTPFEAIDIIRQDYIDKLDGAIWYTFLRKMGDNFIGQRVTLNTGGEGKIVFMPSQDITRPIVEIDGKLIDLSREETYRIENFA
ncbi:HD-GYP domain-containing protein [Isachenkonia alkalipeptolytica]|uniref:HD-GYP domain-containing protein n=1 Tax=Isachenkonia alkalipeptolytica TaxID=2565777 RepID=A0AA43XNG1_9CLOT|nr:HD-GYP domain-containing protein [Isachenkonia alkalipeptolytica]NBG89075.1 HD-GYP domain-containing protein [Isachenkonia alkalipeptolytica]